MKGRGILGIKHPQNKGKAGEREWRDVLNKKFDVRYERTPCSGGMDLKGDVRRAFGSRPSILDLYHWEVKRQQSVNVHKYLLQATIDSRGKTPVVTHRRNNESWKITMWAEDFLNVLKELEDLKCPMV